MKLSSEEKTILIVICAAAVTGIIINFLFSYRDRIQEKENAPQPLLIDINAASVEELDRLPGIGKVIAERIASDRERNGKFNSTEDLKRVKGITKKKLEKISRYLTASGTQSKTP